MTNYAINRRASLSPSPFDELLGSFLMGNYSLEQPEVKMQKGLNFNSIDEENATILEVEVPGVNPENITVKLEGKQLSVTTPRGNLVLPLGTRIDLTGSTAKLKHGLLTIRIPKRSATVVEVKVDVE